MKKIIIFLLLIISSIPVLSYAKKISLEDLYQKAEETAQQQKKINQQRLNLFLVQKGRQAKLVKDIKKRLTQEQAYADQLKKKYDQQEKILTKLVNKLNEQSGELKELFAIIHEVAGDTQSLLNNSYISAQFPERSSKLEPLTSQHDFYSINNIKELWLILQHEMTWSSKIVRYSTKIIQANGVEKIVDVSRIGPFTAIANGKFLKYSPLTKEFTELSRQPSHKYLSYIEDWEAAEKNATEMIIDPSRGSILNMLIQTPTLKERIHQGGLVGYVIILIGLGGLIFSFYRYIYLWKINKKVQQQLINLNNLNGDNPLGRILLSAENIVDDGNHELLELKLGESIIKEIPKLQQGNTMIKLLSAVSPMLGLLGTVIGMISTFQSITLFGTGDPKLMADGISQALITTVLGIIVAIPMVFFYNLLNNSSKNIIQILDEQSAGLIVTKAEAKNVVG